MNHETTLVNSVTRGSQKYARCNICRTDLNKGGVTVRYGTANHTNMFWLCDDCAAKMSEQLNAVTNNQIEYREPQPE